MTSNIHLKNQIVIFKYDILFPQLHHFSKVNKETLNKKIGNRIVQLRTEKGWSQADLARACGKDRQAIEKLENGKVNPTLFSLYEIAVSLEISLAQMMNFK